VAGIDGVALGAIGAGSLFLYAGIRGVSILKELQSITQGKAPPAGNGVTAASSSSSSSSAFLGLPGIQASALPTGGTFTAGQLAALWVQAGGDQAQAQNAACHAEQESSGSATVTSPNPDGGINVGLWQLDTRGKGSGYTVAQLQNALNNARITVLATNNGRDWSAWATPGC
jgi:Lysozyme like domain